MDEDKKKRRKMPSAPILAPSGNVKGIGKQGWFTGGLTPTVVPAQPGRPNPMKGFMTGYIYNSSKPKK